MSKDAYIEAHQEVVGEYLDANPDADWHEAYEATADGAWDRMRDNMADRIDAARDAYKEGLIR